MNFPKKTYFLFYSKTSCSYDNALESIFTYGYEVDGLSRRKKKIQGLEVDFLVTGVGALEAVSLVRQGLLDKSSTLGAGAVPSKDFNVQLSFFSKEAKYWGYPPRIDYRL